ncbi:MAG TPA: hypothetical protein VN193_01980 [Candidatus Angelobacter sp.]|jgi:hypothetical protein|nr:hypothetical protein [Candidatus Angelobacter sp.]
MVVTLFGVVAVSFMMCMYALERRHPAFIAAFALGCVLSSAYGFLSGAWPFGAVELVWSGIAVRRYRHEAGEQRTRSRQVLSGVAHNAPGAGDP